MNCKICGTPIEPGSNFCLSCGTPVTQNPGNQTSFDNSAPAEPVQPQFMGAVPPAYADSYAPKKPKNTKKILTVIISIVLALSIVAGGVTIALRTIPTTAIPLAAKNTLFNSSEFDITFTMDYESGSKITGDIYLLLGDDIDSSLLDCTFKYGSDKFTFEIEEGVVYYDGEEEGELSELFEDLEDDFINDYAPEDVDIAEELDKIINKKISLKAFEKAFDDIIAPTIENILSEEEDIEIDIPDFDDLVSKVLKIAKAGTDYCHFEKSDLGLSGTTYEVVYDDYVEFNRAILETAFEDEFVNEIIDQTTDDFDKDEFIGNAVENAEKAVEEETLGTTYITIKSNRITNITIEGTGVTYEFEIDSKR